MFGNEEDDRAFEEGFEMAREHAREVKDAIRYIQQCNEQSTTYGAHIFALKDELLREGYISETETEFVVTPEGADYANMPGLPSLARIMHDLGAL